MNTPEPREIPIDQIKPFISRARPKAEFEAMKANILARGLKTPIQVRDLGRRGADGIRYELICGEGRVIAFRELGRPKITALVVDAPKAEIAGRFLAENLMRKNQSWADKGRLIREEVNRGQSIEKIAHDLNIEPRHAAKLLRVVNKIAPDLDDALDGMKMNDAEVLTTLPAEGQKIVMEVVRETQQPVQAIVRKARRLQAKGDGWTKAALQKAIRSVDEQLAKFRNTLKRLRLHHSIGPVNCITLSRDKSFRKLAGDKLNFTKLEEASR